MNIKGTGTAVLAISALALQAASPAFAQMVDIGEVVVTPNRTATDRTKVGSKVETVTQEEIEQESKPLLTDYLTLLPGIHVAPPGGRGQETSLSIRGADKKYIKTLFDGIDISDPSATQVQSAWEHVIAGPVTGIEVLKGSQGTLYGADAVAGVIGISTLGGIDLGIHHEISVEGGSFGTVRGGYRLSGASETGRAALNIHGLHTDGISAADSRFGNTERDAYRNVTATFAGEQRVTEAFSVFGSALYVDSFAEFDDSGNPPRDNPFNEARSTQRGARVGFNADLLDGRFRNTVSVQGYDVDRDLHTVSSFGPFDGNYRGQRAKADYLGAFDVSDWLTVQFGLDHERQSAKVTDNYGTNTSESFGLTGIWGQVIVEPVAGLTLTGAARHDEHSVFGGYSTYRLTGSYQLADFGTRFHASLGTGFRAPSLYELFAPFGTGNPDLKPEESTSFDIGVEQTFLEGRMIADVTYFQLDTKNLIDYSSSTFSYVQIPGVTRRNGVEASLAWAATPWLDIKAAYTFTRTRQADGLRRPRVPAHVAALSATVRPAERWEITGTARAVIDTEDRVSVPGGFQDVAVDDFVLVDARVSYRPTDNTELYVRGENLLNQKYQTVKGYGMPGIGVYAGFRARF